MSGRQGGFTLIEMMTVVGVISVLMAIATPSYQGYLARAQVAEATRLLAGARTPLVEYYSTNGMWPASTTGVVAVVEGSYTANLELTTGATLSEPAATLTATLKSSGVNRHLQGKTLTLSTADAGASWTCRSADIATDYLPASCR